ncbi:SDR family NAD(P)-dependent oxidoreductase [Tabrizicola sp.]|uniref:SDR family NAD(P)-dependent oxidoreductase n=1 Tax=Tabrizicola sp. TaxID=2005166 RepID=UPI002604C017|nr:SDR family NAD(P)-dependent oxidoreductase [Tabrizicola sp.]MDM7932584.1 SDR family NAD(P)-dependent oxidoreductase [Tabrizicola sp.]
MRDFTGKRYWLVGASEGLGLALAHKLSAAGAEVILSARSEDALQQAVASLPGKASALSVDVGSSASVDAAAARLGDLDGMVFLAGVYWPMRAQDWDAKAAEAMANVNFTGCIRAVGAALPGMVAKGRGHVVITGSLSGFRGLPGAIGYAASKAGTMVLAESLYADLRQTGIAVQLANPGFIRTRLTAKNDFTMPFIMEPEAAADIMFRHMQSGRFKISFPTAFSWLFRGGQFLPDWLYYRIFPPKP